MSSGVKGPPGARRRGDRARQTRLRIVRAARDLFLADGYAATTLEQVAVRADVAVQTVYFHFRNKATVLKHVMDLAATGDDEPVALLERPWMDEMRASPDGAGAVSVWLDMSRVVYARVAPVMRVVREAGSDPETAEQQRVNKRQTLTAHRALAEHLSQRGSLREDMAVEQAGEVLYGLVSLELYVLFTDELGWSPEQWQGWTTDAVVRAVLRPSGSATAATGG